MNILKKRPLSLILCVMLGVFSFFADFRPVVKFIIAGFLIIAFMSTFVFKNLKLSRNAMVKISLACVFGSLIISALWSLSFFPNTYDGSDARISARVYEIDNSDSHTSKLTIKTDCIDGKKDSHKFYAYINKNLATNIRRYDAIEFEAVIHSYLDSSTDGIKSYYVSDGYSGYVNNISALEITGNKIPYIYNFFSELRLNLSNTLKIRTNYDTGAFLSALIIGDKTNLDGNTRLNFSRIGISHILALSGMHLAILSLALNKMLMLLHVNKKYRVVISSIITLFYMILTGMSSSVMRAGIMLLITGGLYLLSAKSDPITSLVIAVSAIVVISPSSVYDLSLWLSAFATLGVIVYSELDKEKESTDKITVKIARGLKNSCMVSIFALSATLAISAIRFETCSIASILSTLIFAFILEILIYIGLFVLIIGSFVPIGALAIIVSDFTKELAEILSSIDWVQISTNFVVLKIMIVIFTAVFFAFIFCRVKHKKIAVTVIILSLIITLITGEVLTLTKRFDDDLVYSPSATGDSFLLKSDGEIVLIYSGKSYEDAAYSLSDFLGDENIVYLNTFVLSSYAYSTVDFCRMFIDNVKTDRILLPTPITKDELNIAEGISDMLSLYGTDMRFYNDMENVVFGKYTYKLYGRDGYKYGVMPSNLFTVSDSSSTYTYVSTCEYENLNTDSKMILYNSKYLFVGTVGNSKYYLFDMYLPDIKNIYYGDKGRIASDVNEYYTKQGASVEYVSEPFSIYN